MTPRQRYDTVKWFMNLVCRQFTAGLVLIAWGAATAWAGQPGEFDRRKAPPKKVATVDFTERGAAVTGTNAPGAVALPAPTLGGLDQAVRKPFEIFKTDDALNGAFTPPRRLPPTLPKSKHARQLEERKKNWAFSTPEEIYGLPTPEELMDLPEFGPDGELKKPKTTFERYLDRMDQSRATSATNQAGSNPGPDWMRPGEREDKAAADTAEKSPAAADGEETSLLTAESKRTPAFDYVKPLGDPNSAISYGDGTFNFSSSGSLEKPAVVRDTARDLRMQEFKQKLLDPRSATVSSWNVSAPTPLASPASVAPFSSGLSAGSLYAPRPISPPTALPSVAPAAPVASYFTPALTPAPAAAAPRQPVAPTSFELPKRKY